MFVFEKLNVSSVRNLADFSIEPGPKINFFFGPNASGKTSVLESIYLLSRIKSFRSKRIHDVIRRGQERLQVYASGNHNDTVFSVGVEKGRGITRIKFDGENVATASEQAKNLPIYILTPDHAMLFTGTPKERRHWLDWSLFHVEQDYLSIWKNYHRALRHRNALLKMEIGRKEAEIEGWEKMMSEEARKLDELRRKYIEQLNSQINKKHLPMVLSGKANVVYNDEAYKTEGLFKSLQESRHDDIRRGYTGAGPHRNDIVFHYDEFTVAKHLSRGQTKLYGAAIICSQISILKKKGVEPIVLVDDLDAELDAASTQRLLELFIASDSQIFVSALQPPGFLESFNSDVCMFHVEHGNIQKMLE